MGGDEIVADWLGDVYSEKFNLPAADPVKRLSTVSKRFRNVVFYCSAGGVYFGKYNSNAATFSMNALYLAAQEKIELKFVDLYEMGVDAAAGAAGLKILGLNEY